jgi:hypothetical protein
MIRIETELFISAPPEKIWEILSDFDKYGEWNELYPRAKGKFEKNAKFLLRVRNPDNSGRLQGYYPKITIIEENKMLAWKFKMFMIPGVFDGVQYFRLTPAGNGTLLTNGATYRGFLANSLRKTILEKYPANFDKMNKALAERAC